MALEDRIKFSKRLKELRNDFGYSPKQFAMVLDVGMPNYYKYEKGEAVPGFDVLIRIANKCNVSLDWLCGRNENRKASDNKEEITSVLKQLITATETGKSVELKILAMVSDQS